MKKECSECKFLCREGYEDNYYVCEIFGENIPNWAEHPKIECCLLKSQELKKIIRLHDDFLIVGTGKVNPETFYPEWTKEDEEHNKKAKKNYDDYVDILKKRCEERKNKEMAKDYEAEE